MWARIGLLSLVLGLLLLIAVAVIAKAIAPYQEAHGMRQQLADTNRQIAQTDAENAAYQRRLAYLQTPEGKTTEARKLGYLRPNEVAVVVEGTPGEFSEAQPTVPRTPPPTLLGRIRQYWRSLIGAR
jgi:cell division protein FtsL